jgi:hypothetical protein
VPGGEEGMSTRTLTRNPWTCATAADRGKDRGDAQTHGRTDDPRQAMPSRERMARGREEGLGEVMRHVANKGGIGPKMRRHGR